MAPIFARNDLPLSPRHREDLPAGRVGERLLDDGVRVEPEKARKRRDLHAGSVVELAAGETRTERGDGDARACQFARERLDVETGLFLGDLVVQERCPEPEPRVVDQEFDGS